MPPAGLLRVKVSVGVAFKSSTNLIYLILIGKGRFLGGELLSDNNVVVTEETLV